MSHKKGIDGLRHDMIRFYGKQKTMIPTVDLKAGITMMPNPESVNNMDNLNYLEDADLIAEAKRLGWDVDRYLED